MVKRRFTLGATLTAGLLLGGCSSAPSPNESGDGSCNCAGSNLPDSAPAEAAVEAGEAGAPVDAPAGADTTPFVGQWAPISGSGQSNCNGEMDPIQPDPEARLTFVPGGQNALTATSSDAPDCTIELRVSGTTASLAQVSESCSVSTGGFVAFTTFDLALAPLPADGGLALEAGLDASGEGGALDWKLVDTEGDCVTTLHYTLARAD
jgi:hypothetical protein